MIVAPYWQSGNEPGLEPKKAEKRNGNLYDNPNRDHDRFA
jgi:hypothetical protein